MRLLLLLFFVFNKPPVEGEATYYRPELMGEVAENRGMSLENYADGVALNEWKDLGEVVWLEWEDGELTGPYLVVDCAAKKDRPKRLRQNYVVEVSANVAKKRGFYGLGPTGVTVYFNRYDWVVRKYRAN